MSFPFSIPCQVAPSFTPKFNRKTFFFKFKITILAFLQTFTYPAFPRLHLAHGKSHGKCARVEGECACARAATDTCCKLFRSSYNGIADCWCLVASGRHGRQVGDDGVAGTQTEHLSTTQSGHSRGGDGYPLGARAEWSGVRAEWAGVYRAKWPGNIGAKCASFEWTGHSVSAKWPSGP